MPDLMTRLHEFDIDGGPVDFPFAERLARENGWTRRYAERVVREYKRFVYLMATAGRPMTPSDQVDQAWHLHLSYTRSYWERLCREIVGRPLHHHPTQGGDAEAKKYDQQYADTLCQYRESFGEEAPVDIWPPTAIRFSSASDGVRAIPQSHWIVPKSIVKTIGIALAAMIVVTVSMGCAGGLNPFEMNGASYLAFFIPTLIVAFIVGIVYRYMTSGPSLAPGEEPSDLRWDQLAYLVGGKDRLATATIARLVERNAAIVDPVDAERLIPKGAGEGLSDVERATRKQLPIDRGNRAALTKLASETEAALATEIHDMVEKGWYRTETSARGQAILSALPIGLVLLVFGVGRLIQGFQNGKPVGYLVISMIIAAVALMILYFAQSRWTRAGRQIVDRERKRHSHLQTAGPSEGHSAATAVALFGTACLVGTAYAGLNTWYPHRSTADGGSYFSSGCGTGCGGDGGGGGGDGGGGCGGCGGGGD